MIVFPVKFCMKQYEVSFFLKIYHFSQMTAQTKPHKLILLYKQQSFSHAAAMPLEFPSGCCFLSTLFYFLVIISVYMGCVVMAIDLLHCCKMQLSFVYVSKFAFAKVNLLFPFSHHVDTEESLSLTQPQTLCFQMIDIFFLACLEIHM